MADSRSAPAGVRGFESCPPHDHSAKNIFELTQNGKETLLTIRERKKESGEKLLQFKNLLIDIFGEEKITMKGLLFEIRDVIDDLSPNKKDQAVKILEKCLADLKRIE